MVMRLEQSESNLVYCVLMLKLFPMGFRTVYITAYLLTGSNQVLRLQINIDIFISILLARQVFMTYKTCIINDKIAIHFLRENIIARALLDGQNEKHYWMEL